MSAARRHPDHVRALLVAITLSLAACGRHAQAPRAQATPRTEPASSAEVTPEVVAEPEAQPEAPPEQPEPPPDPVAVLLSADGTVSTSIGGPNDGRVEGAVALPLEGPGFRSNPRRPNTDAVFGTVEMVQALVRAAAVVNEEMPGSILFINDLGFREGGPIAHHGSHRAGRDVDVLFYLIDRHGEPMEPVGAFLDARGRGYDFRDLATPRDDVLVRMDVPRTWRFVQALLEGDRADDVQRIFIAEHLRTLVLAQAERAGAPRAVRDRFADITCQPGYPHDDHLHIRFHCTPDDIAHGCEDTPPVYPWRRARLAELGLEPVIHRPRRDRPRAPTTSVEEARASAGPMHTRVLEWLERREAWMRPPRTGRPFCR